jgi:glutaredoxin
MSMFGRLLPSSPTATVERTAVESPVPSGRATEQAEPRNAETRRPSAPVEEANAVPAADRNEDSAEVARRLKNQLEEKKERLAHARRNVSITMYSTSWCRVCKDARKYLSEAGITYDEYDVDTDRDADKRLRAVNPRHTVPTFDIDGAVLTGFSPGAIESMLTTAAARRAERE